MSSNRNVNDNPCTHIISNFPFCPQCAAVIYLNVHSPFI